MSVTETQKKEPKPVKPAIESFPLHWPQGWPRTRLENREGNKAWKVDIRKAQDLLLRELQRLGATAVMESEIQ